MAPSTARRYPAAPKPAMVAVMYGEITESWRQCSRASGLEMCSSTFTPSNVASASASANE